MVQMRRFLLLVIVLAVLTMGIVQWETSGYRFSPSAALRSSSFIPRDAKIIDHHNYHWCTVYVMKTGSMYVTAVVEKTGLFWLTRGTWKSSQSQEPIQTIGWASFSDGNHHIGFLEVESNDPQIASIVAGPSENREKRNMFVAKPVTFAWNSSSPLSGDYHPIALSSTGNKMYYYGYSTNSREVNFSTDLKWHRVS